MFCGKCGAQLEDDAKFCPACGAVIEQNTASEKQKPSGSGIAKIMKSPSRMIGVAAVVLVVILAVVLGFGGKSPEKIAAKACETELNQDVKDITNCWHRRILIIWLGHPAGIVQMKNFNRYLQIQQKNRHGRLVAPVGMM